MRKKTIAEHMEDFLGDITIEELQVALDHWLETLDVLFDGKPLH